ncbi:DEAD/DEAH box helicase [Paenibacillus marinisediminis]
MQVMLYTVRSRTGWHMGLTLNGRVDIKYWMEEWRGGTPLGEKLVMLNQLLPLPIALRASQKFEAHSDMDSWGEEEWGRYFDGFLIMAYTIDLGYQEQTTKRIDVRIFGRRQVNEIAGRYADNSYVREIATAYETNTQRMMPRYDRLVTGFAGIITLSERLCELLEGRSLFESEILSLLESYGEKMDRGTLHAALQWGVLHGKLALTNGIAWGEGGSTWIRFGQRTLRLVGKSFHALKFRLPILHDPKLNDDVSHTTEPYCRRCGGRGEKLQESVCESCGSKKCLTCTECLNLGRSRSCALLVIGLTTSDPVQAQAHKSYGPSWNEGKDASDESDLDELMNPYHLAPAQRDASMKALKYLEGRRVGGTAGKGEFLLWAVTGAGKTEMMFPLVGYALAARKRVCIATPRRDVVLELKPRIERAFANAKVATLYGGSAERWVKAEITLATTHQLLRFAHAFELVVVDELDAYPYHNNPMLQRAAQQALKPGGTFVFLSATPPAPMQRAVRRGQLAQAIVPVRYHRHPLPVPERMAMPGVARCIARGHLPRCVTAALRQAVARGAQVFVFVARIRHVEGMVRLLRAVLAEQPVAGTSAADAERTEKVLRFRQGDIRVLVTTTILERGVTVPRSDVFILDADDKLFDTSSLVQMAGRAGRSKDDPHGRVVFAAPQWTSAQRGAVRQIRRMNRLAKRGGYLLDGAS